MPLPATHFSKKTHFTVKHSASDTKSGMSISKRNQYFLCALTLMATICSCSRILTTGTITQKTHGQCYTGAFTDEKNGYAAGDFGLVLYTHDGGQSWKQAANTSMALFCFESINATSAIFGGTRGNITKTTDGGLTWERLPDLTNVSVKSISFVDEMNGWFAAKNWLGRTSDGGKTCTEIQLPEGVLMIEAIGLKTANDGFILASNGTVYKTDNSGESWTECGRLLDPRNNAFKPLFLTDNPGAAIRFDSDKGYIVVIGSISKTRALRIYSSKDGGLNWSELGTQKLSTIPISLFISPSMIISAFNIDTTVSTYTIPGTETK